MSLIFTNTISGTMKVFNFLLLSLVSLSVFEQRGVVLASSVGNSVGRSDVKEFLSKNARRRRNRRLRGKAIAADLLIVDPTTGFNSAHHLTRIRARCSEMIKLAKSQWNSLPAEKQRAIVIIGNAGIEVVKRCVQLSSRNGRCAFVTDIAVAATKYCLQHDIEELPGLVSSGVEAFCTAVRNLNETPCMK